MSMNRFGERGETPNRADRVFQKDSYWYYRTREGVNIGPFDSRQDASNGVVEFIDFVSSANPKALQTLYQCAGYA